MLARLPIFLVFLSLALGYQTVRSNAQSRPQSGKGTAVIGMIHHVSGTTLTLKDVRVVGSTQPPAGLGTDGLLEVIIDKKTRGATSDLNAGDMVELSYTLDRRKRQRALTVAPAPR